jgi:ubiquinone/menaquinone biosynthesis C-methylase UbiE
MRNPVPESPMSSDQVRHPVFARVYARLSRAEEKAGVADQRRLLLSGLSGSVIEVGAGNGLNFAHYPATVSRVLAIEPEPHMRSLAVRSAADAAAPVEITSGVAEGLPVADGAFDAAVAAFMLCSVGHPAAVLAELHRVLKAGGQLRFLEHVQAQTPGLRRFQHALDATIWPLILGGCHCGRNTAAAIEQAGFRIEQIERFQLPESRLPWPTSPHIRGCAVKPSVS